MSETQKPFACVHEGCKMTFTNEDHLNVHKKKHDMALHLGIDSQSNPVADQTPTPTRFIRNCEEVGLFQDLQNVNPFDETFRKATELVKTGSLHVPDADLDDTLHTPHILPHIEEQNNINKFSRHNSNEPEFVITVINDDDLLKLNNTNSNINEKLIESKSNPEVSSETLSIGEEDSEKEELILTLNDTPNKDNLISNNKSVKKPMPGLNPLASPGIPSAVVHNLSEIQISVERNYTQKIETRRDGITRVKLKEALRNKFKTDKEFDEHIEISKVESPSKFSTSKMESLNKNIPKPINDSIRLDPLENDATQKNKKQLQLERQREVNRAAQVRCREKKKYLINQMEQEINILKDEKKELWIENQNLKNEIIWLKTMLLYHKDCPVAKDPQIMKEINALVKASKEELEKKMEKTSEFSKKVVPIRPNAPNVVALTPISNSVLVQVPNTNSKNAAKLSTLPSSSVNSMGGKTSTGNRSTIPKLIPSIIPNNSAILTAIPSQPANYIIGVPLNVNIAHSNHSNVIKERSKIVRVKSKSKMHQGRVERVRITKSSITVPIKSNSFMFDAAVEPQTPAKMFKNS